MQKKRNLNNTTAIQWHNIIDNPKDLPEEEDILLTTVELRSGKRYVTTTVGYDQEYDLWYIEDSHNYVLNILMEFQIPEDTHYYFDEEFASDKVIAWAYLPEPYVG